MPTLKSLLGMKEKDGRSYKQLKKDVSVLKKEDKRAKLLKKEGELKKKYRSNTGEKLSMVGRGVVRDIQENYGAKRSLLKRR